MNLIYIVMRYLSEIHINITLPPTLKIPNGLLPSDYSIK
jgi:hypothetical protein